MFEKYVERLLNRYLAPYVDGISKDTVDLLKGDLVLQNLKVKQEAFEFLKSSGVLLHAGTIKKIHIKIPWRSLTTGKIVVEVDTIAVDIGRIHGDVPDDSEILADFRKSKAAQVEKKVANIFELKELTENLKEQTSSFGARFVHRIIQNLVIDIRQAAVRLVDLKQDLIIGFLLGCLSVHTVGATVDDPTKNILRKQIDVEDLAAFCRVDKQPLCYILEPTVLRLRVDHMASTLCLILELLDHDKDTPGGMFALSKSAMTRLIVVLQELQAWQEHLSSIVLSECQSVKVDAESLKGVTKDKYVQMWRRKLMEEKAMTTSTFATSTFATSTFATSDEASQADTKEPLQDVELQAIEDAVPARHLALWRIEVQKQMKSAEDLQKVSTKRWWPFKSSSSSQTTFLNDDDWDDIKKKVDKEQASLAELDDPQTKELVIELKQFGAMLYDNIQLEAGAKTSAAIRRTRDRLRTGSNTGMGSEDAMMTHAGEKMPAWIPYVELCEHLNKEDFRSSIIHSFSVMVTSVRSKVNLETLLISDEERSEWTLNAVLGLAKVCCDRHEVLRFGNAQAEEEKVNATGASKVTMRNASSRKVAQDDIALYSRVQDDGRDLITTSVRLPPVVLTLSPYALKTGMDLVNFDLPPSPVFSSYNRQSLQASDADGDSSFTVGACGDEYVQEHSEVGAADQDLLEDSPGDMHTGSVSGRKSIVKPPRKTTGNANEMFSDWKEEEQERILEMANHQIERVKEGALTFELDISIAAPQVTIMVDDYSLIRLNLGNFSCLSDDAMTVNDFNVRLDLKETHIMCTVEEPGLVKKVFPVLEPISLSVTLKGEPSGEMASFVASQKQTPPLKVTADVMLEKLQLKVHPAATHLFLRLPLVYSMLVGSEKEDEHEQGYTDAETSFSLARIRPAATDEPTRAESKPARSSISSETSSAEAAIFIHGSVAVELVRLGVFDINGKEVAHTEVVELTGEVKSGPAEISASTSLRHILVEVGGQPLVYMKDEITPAIEEMPEQALEESCDSKASKAHGIDVKILIPVKDSATTPTSARIEICPIVISWQKQRVGALYTVMMSCMLPAPAKVRKQSLYRASVVSVARPDRASLISPERASFDGTAARVKRPSVDPVPQAEDEYDAQKEQSKLLAVSGLDADTALPPLNASAPDKTIAGCLAVDILFGGLEIDLNVSEEEALQLPPPWKGFRNAPLIHFNAHGVKVHFEGYAGEESCGHAVLQEVFVEYDGQRIAAPWQMDKALLEFDFCTYNTRGHGDPVYSLCLKGIIRQLSFVFFLKHLDSLVAYLTDNILGALVTAAATQAAEAVQQQAEQKILLWNIAVESPVVYVSRDVEVLHQSPTWEHTKCSLQNLPMRDDFTHPTPIVSTFAQCCILRPGTIQACCQYELDTWAMRIHVGFKDCRISMTDSEGYAVGPICDLFNWELTIRPSPSSSGSLHVSVGMHFFPLNVNISQAQFILVLNTLNENLSYSRYFPVEAAHAPEGSQAAAMPQFAARYYADDEVDPNEDSSSSESEDSKLGPVENMRMNIRMEFESMQVAVAYSTPGSCITADSQQTPLLRVGATDVRMMFDAVSYYEGEGMLFSYGFFVNNIYADDLRPDTFRTCCHDRILECRTESSSYAAPGNEDSWKLVVDRDEGEKPWLPEQVAWQIMFTKTSLTQSILTINVVQPRLFFAIQLIMDTVFIVINALMESTLVKYASAELPSELEPEQVEVDIAPSVISFNFRIEGLTLYLMTNCKQPTAPLIEVMASLGVEFDFISGEPMKIHEVDVYDVSISRSEDSAEGSFAEDGDMHAAGKSRSTVRLVQLTKLTTVGSVGASCPRPHLNMLVHVLPCSVRLSTRDVPYLIAAASSVGSDGEPLLKVFSLERDRLATSEGVCACGAKLASGQVFCRSCGSKRGSILDDLLDVEKDVQQTSSVGTPVAGRPRVSTAASVLQYSSASANSVGTLKIRAISFQGVRAPRVNAHEEVWVTVEFLGWDEMSFALQWGVMSEISVPAKNQGMKLFGAAESGLEVSEEGITLQLKLWRGAGFEGPECLGVLSFPVGLCVGDGLECRRQMRPTNAQHSMLVAREHLPPLELEFEAHFQESQSSIAARGGVAPLLEFSAPEQTLDDFLRPVENLEDFLGAPVPKGPFSSIPKTGRRTTHRGSIAGTASMAAATSLVSHQASSASTEKPPFAVRLVLSIDGFEALFLDDCQAKVLPVLRYFFRAKSKLGSDGASVDRHVLQDALGAEGAGGIRVEMNPWEAGDIAGITQRKGVFLRVEDCTLGIQYLNSRAGHWEPFLEQWSFDLFVEAQAEHEAEELMLEESKSNAQYPAALEIKLVSFMPLLVNASPQLFTLAAWLLNNQETYMAQFRGQDLTGSAKHTDLSDARYRLLNLSGKPIKIVLFRPRSQEEKFVHAELFDDSAGSRSSSFSTSMRVDSFEREQTSKSIVASSKAIAAPSESSHLKWHEFQSCEKEIDLDELLGNRTAEQWRELADESVTCAVEMATDIVIELPRLDFAEEDTEQSQDGTSFAVTSATPFVPLSTSTFSGTSFSGKMSFGANPESEAKRAILSLSSASESILPIESNPRDLPIYAACENLSPHPSHHLLVVSSGLRIFNHTGRAFHVYYRAGDKILPFGDAADAEDAVLAAPFSLLPLRVAMPKEIASALQIQPVSSSLEGKSMQELAAEEIMAQTYTMQREATAKEDATEKTANSQWLKPQCFCAAPLEVSAFTTSIQLGLPGGDSKSNLIALDSDDAQGDSSRHAEVLIKDRRNLLRFHAYVIHAPEHSIAKTLSVHIYTPLRLINATPVKLQFVFEVPQGENSAPTSTKATSRRFSAHGVDLTSFGYGLKVNRFVVDLDPLSDCDLPPDIDPSEPYGVSLMITNASHTASSEVRHHSPPVPGIFDSNYGTPEELVAVPLGQHEIDKRGEGVLMLTISRGLICSVTCQRWLIDRTGLGLRVIHSLQGPTATSLALPQLGSQQITLLSPSYQKWMRTNFPEMKRMQYHLAVPSDGNDWTAAGQVKLPDMSESITYAAISVPFAEVADGPGSFGSRVQQDGQAYYPVHVCLHAEALSLELTFGTPCHIISVLPQVVIYNKVADDDIDVRAVGDPYTEVLVESQQLAQFLRWRPTKNPKHLYARSKLHLEFRPRQLNADANWSAPIKVSSKSCSSQSVVFSATKRDVKLPNMLRMYMVEVAEQDGVLCFTVTRGSRCELRNFSRLVEKVAITPRRPDGFRQRNAPQEETFVVRLCESVEFAWPSQGSELQLDVVLQWNRKWIRETDAGSKEFVIPDVYKPAQFVHTTPGGWRTVVVRTGCTNDITWIQVHDFHSAVEAPTTATFAGTVSRVLGLDNEPQRTNLAQLKLGVSLSGIGISLISEIHELELMYAEVQQVGLLVGAWDDRWSLEVLISDAQVDCQLLDFKENPVVLANRGENSLPFLQVKVDQRLPTSRYGMSFPLIGVQIDCMEVDLNDQFLLDVVGTLSKLLDLVSASQGVTREQLNMWRSKPLTGSLESPPSLPMQVSINELVFLGLEVHLWAKVSLNKLPVPLRKPLQLLTAGSDSFSVDGATLRMSPEVFDGIQGAAPRVMKTLLERYYWNFFISLGSVLGRSSLFTLPALPVKWGRRGVTHAMRAVDFFIHRAADVFEILTLDEQYIRRKKREHQQRLRDITGLRSGLSTAALHLGSGLLHIADIVREPIAGAQNNGFAGFVTGIGKGLMGTVVKPVIEVGFSARAITRAVRVKSRARDQNKARRVTTRRRPPRVTYGSGGIREYDEAAALLTLEVATASPVPGTSQKDLIAIEQAKFGITDHVVVERVGATPHIRHLLLLVSPFQLLLVSLDSKGIAVRWTVPLMSLRGARASSHGVVVWEEAPAANSRGESGTCLVGHQVPCSDAAVISSIFWMLQDVQAKGIAMASGMTSRLDMTKQGDKEPTTRWEKMRRGFARMTMSPTSES